MPRPSTTRNEHTALARISPAFPWVPASFAPGLHHARNLGQDCVSSPSDSARQVTAAVVVQRSSQHAPAHLTLKWRRLAGQHRLVHGRARHYNESASTGIRSPGSTTILSPGRISASGKRDQSSTPSTMRRAVTGRNRDSPSPTRSAPGVWRAPRAPYLIKKT